MKEGTGGILISAPTSGAGKTTITLGILRALHRRGVGVRGAKSGPDYIDPRFHEAACRSPCLNLDAWAMSPSRLRSLAQGPGLLVVEGAMGLFDGAPPDGNGSAADIARHLGLPVILVVDAARTAQSVAPIVKGFAAHDPRIEIAGVILNRVGSLRHAAVLKKALAPTGIRVLGVMPRKDAFALPSRHLGLVQAQENPDLDKFMDSMADQVDLNINLDELTSLALPLATEQRHSRMKPPGQRIAVAHDTAFSFAYPHMLADWRDAGAEIATFSPLNNNLVPDADFIYLPGGYPELHAGRLAAADKFRASLAKTAEKGVPVYGECGGYMILGDGLVDADGARHRMTGLLRLETSFAKRKLHLGYRKLQSTWGALAGTWAGHEFHYASTLRAEGKPLFKAQDAEGLRLEDAGLVNGSVCGAFTHLIDQAAEDL